MDHIHQLTKQIMDPWISDKQVNGVKEIVP
jgi:hypothetical protein